LDAPFSSWLIDCPDDGTEARSRRPEVALKPFANVRQCSLVLASW
jgi:hypothetical protein